MIKPFPRATGDVVLSADLYNRMVEAIERANNLTVSGNLGIIESPTGITIVGLENLPDGMCAVLNNSGSDRNDRDILGIDGPLHEASDSLVGYQNNIQFKGVVPVAPDHYGRWGVCVGPIPSGKMGLLRVSGLAVVRLHVNDPTDLCAGISSGDPTQLQSGPVAVAQILATSVASGVTWAYVRLGTTIESEVFNCGSGSGS